MNEKDKTNDSVADENEEDLELARRRRLQELRRDAQLLRLQKRKEEAERKRQTSAYVDGLPPDATATQLEAVFARFGLLAEDARTGAAKIKLYTDPLGVPKGDALVTFLKPESVDLAIDILDETSWDPPAEPAVCGGGLPRAVIRVSRAVFKSLPGDDPAADPVRAGAHAGAAVPTSIDPRERALMKAKRSMLERKLEWRPEDVKIARGSEDAERAASAAEAANLQPERFRKCVILKNMFTKKEVADDPGVLLDIKQDILDECSKMGNITKVVLYEGGEDANDDCGVVLVKFDNVTSAEYCVMKMHGRFFAARQLEAFLWSGQRYRKSQSKTSASAPAVRADIEMDADSTDSGEEGFSDNEKKEKDGAAAAAADAGSSSFNFGRKRKRTVDTAAAEEHSTTRSHSEESEAIGHKSKKERLHRGANDPVEALSLSAARSNPARLASSQSPPRAYNNPKQGDKEEARRLAAYEEWLEQQD